MSFRRLLWIEDLLLPLAVLVLRLCWLWPWLELVRRWVSPHTDAPYLPLGALVILGAGGYIAARQAMRQEAITGAIRAAVIGLGVVVMLVILWSHYAAPVYGFWDMRGVNLLIQEATDWSVGPPPAFLALILGFVFWIQGVRDTTPLSRHEQVWKTFGVGFGALALMLLVVQLDERGMPPGTGAAIWVFFGVGMAALALSALEYAGLGQEKGAAMPGMSRYWLGSMLAVVGGILGIGLILVLLLAPSMIAAAFANLRFLLDWLGAILGVLLVVTAYLVFLIIEPIFNFLREYMEIPEPEEEALDTQSLNQMLDSFWADPSSILPEAVADSLPWVALLLTVVALAVAVTIALRILRGMPEESFVETRESVFSADLLQDQLSSLWQRLIGGNPQAKPDPFLSLEHEEDRRRAVRAIYQEFLAHMQTLGHPRLPQLTPASYGQHVTDILAPTLATAPSSDSRDQAVEILTAGYVQARYGDVAPTPSEVAAVKQAWVSVRATLTTQQAADTTDETQQPDSEQQTKNG